MIIAIGYFQKDELLHLINMGGSLSIFISMTFLAICVFFPIIPFPVLAGTIGAIFGTAQGFIISLTGSMIGSMCLFFLSRYGFRDLAQKKLMNYPKVQEYEMSISQNSFLAVLIFRLIPIFPALVVNVIFGLSKVKWLSFFVASTIGKIPNALILSYAGSTFTSNKLFSFGLYGVYLLIVFLIYCVIVNRKMSKN
jgi:uncharacterized membrane protein YdjX (TVP38/TMEM64 family)